MKTRIIINIDGDLSDEDALNAVSTVVRNGKISEDSQGNPQYCFITTFAGLTVYCPRKYSKTATNVFSVSSPSPRE